MINTNQNEKTLERILDSLVDNLIPEKGVPVDTLSSTDYFDYKSKRLEHYYYFGKDFTADLEHDYCNRNRIELKVYTKSGNTISILRDAKGSPYERLEKNVDGWTSDILPLRSGDIDQGLFEKIAQEIKNKKLPIDGKGHLMKDIIGECDGHDVAYLLNTLELIQGYNKQGYGKLSNEWSKYGWDNSRSSDKNWIYSYTHRKSKVDIGCEMSKRNMTKKEKLRGIAEITTPVYFMRGHPTSDREIIKTFKLYIPGELECEYRKENNTVYDPERFEG